MRLLLTSSQAVYPISGNQLISWAVLSPCALFCREQLFLCCSQGALPCLDSPHLMSRSLCRSAATAENVQQDPRLSKLSALQAKFQLRLSTDSHEPRAVCYSRERSVQNSASQSCPALQVSTFRSRRE
jgi:hypothetical protein